MTSISCRVCLGLAAFMMSLAIPPAADCLAGEPPARPGDERDDLDSAGASRSLQLLRRKVSQDQGAWVIDYEIRYTGETRVIRIPLETKATVEGWVSNSRVASHALPRLSRVTVGGGSANSGTGDVIASNDESQRCRERAVLSVWTEDGSPSEASTSVMNSLALTPGANFHVRLRLDHQHVIYGDYDPLLGVRNVAFVLGAATLHDEVALDREHYLALPHYAWPEAPADRRDARYFVSAPDSLHLEADIPGHKYYRLPDRPVRYGTRMRLRFWYLIAAGTEGECRVRFDQYKDTPSSWRVLSSGGFEQPLDTVGRWTKVERIIRTDAEATTAALGFRIISETDVGEMWVDDVSLEPLCQTNQNSRP